MVDGGVCVPVINFIIRVYLQTVNESFLMSYFRLFAASYQLYNEYYSCYNDSCYSINKLNAIFIIICHFN